MSELRGLGRVDTPDDSVPRAKDTERRSLSDCYWDDPEDIFDVSGGVPPDDAERGATDGDFGEVRDERDSPGDRPDRPGGVADLYASDRVPTREELMRCAEAQGWTMQKRNPDGPPIYLDENGVRRLTIKQGSPRTPGSGGPHVEIRDADGRRTDPFGTLVTRRHPDNHYPFREEPEEDV